VLFHMQMPASWSDRKKQLFAGRPHQTKPDISNLLKFVEDVASGVLFHDDSLIVQVHARKIYSIEGGTLFTMRELGNGDSSGISSYPG